MTHIRTLNVWLIVVFHRYHHPDRCFLANMSTQSLPTTTRVWVVQNHAEGQIKLSKPYGVSETDTFALKTQDLPSADALPENALLVQTLAISNDPAQRIWIDKVNKFDRPDMRPLEVGAPFHAFTLSKVLAVGGAQDGKFKVGDLVTGRSRWAEYVVLEKEHVQLVQ